MTTVKNLLAAALLGAATFPVFAQGVKIPNTAFGFSTGVNQPLNMDFPRTGITLGADMYHYRTNNLGLSFKPALTLAEYQLPDMPGGVEKSLLEIPLHGVAAIGKGRVKPVFETGPNYRVDLAAVKSSELAWDASLGVEIPDTWLRIKKDIHTFSILPELRYSYSREVQMVYFSFHFLGAR